jgi:hypothetical protein
LTAGSAAWAQTYSTDPGTQGSYSQGYHTTTPGTQRSYNEGHNSNPSTQGYSTQNYSNQGTYGSSQGTWNPGKQGTSTPYGSQGYPQAGYGPGNITTYQQAEQELTRYDYNNVHDLRQCRAGRPMP